METRQKSNEVLVERLLPALHCNSQDRAMAWEEWYASVGVSSVLAFVRVTNDTATPDDDLVHDAIATAYEQVECGRYEPRLDIPFTAYVKGIARNKIREARRRSWRYVALDDAPARGHDGLLVESTHRGDRRGRFPNHDGLVDSRRPGHVPKPFYRVHSSTLPTGLLRSVPW